MATSQHNGSLVAGPGSAGSSGDRATIAARAAADERQARLTRHLSLAAALVIAGGLIASVWYAGSLAQGPAGSSPAAAQQSHAATASAAATRATFAAASRRPAYPSFTTSLAPAAAPAPGANIANSGNRAACRPLHDLLDVADRSDAARFWDGASESERQTVDSSPSAAQALTAVDALESLTTLVSHPRRYAPPLRPYVSPVSREMRGYLQVTALAAGSGERSATLQEAATGYRNRCRAALSRLDEAAAKLDAGNYPPSYPQ